MEKLFDIWKLLSLITTILLVRFERGLLLNICSERVLVNYSPSRSGKVREGRALHYFSLRGVLQGNVGTFLALSWSIFTLGNRVIWPSLKIVQHKLFYCFKLCSQTRCFVLLHAQHGKSKEDYTFIKWNKQGKKCLYHKITSCRLPPWFYYFCHLWTFTPQIYSNPFNLFLTIL